MLNEFGVLRSTITTWPSFSDGDQRLAPETFKMTSVQQSVLIRMSKYSRQLYTNRFNT